MLERVTAEIEGLHKFFVGWFTGALPEDTFGESFLVRFSKDMVFIPPAGRFLGIEDLSNSVRAGYGSNPHFRIQIRNVRVHKVFDGHILATYEEWQRNALASTPPNNGRLATVIFTDSDRLQWLHIHETWLPDSVIQAGPYDF